MRNFVCYLFGHKLPKDEFWSNNNIEHCDRCLDDRSPYQCGQEWWAHQECYGILGYPYYKVKWFIINLWYKIKMKIKDLFTKRDDSVPF